MIKSCRSEEDYRQLLAESEQGPVFLMKHSTRCPISANAHSRYIQFADEHPDVACWEVLVIESRPVSNLISEETGIPHQSPQAILFMNGKACWHTSHGSISRQALLDALEKCRAGE